MSAIAEPNILELLRYNNWANGQILALCQGLNDEQLAAATPGAYGSIREILGHLIRAEADYAGRITGNRLPPLFKWEDGPAVADMAAYAERVGAELLAVAQRTPPLQNVHEEEGGLTMDYQARVLFFQTIIHGVEHRTNITTTLSSLGVALPELDAWGYLFARADEFGLSEGTA